LNPLFRRTYICNKHNQFSGCFYHSMALYLLTKRIIIVVWSLFNDAFSLIQTIKRRMKGW
jgi:hypothetical protein